jgi:hypothetical protein
MAIRYLYTLMDSGEMLSSVCSFQNGAVMERLVQLGASYFRSPEIQRVEGESHREVVRLQIEKLAGLLWHSYRSTEDIVKSSNGIYYLRVHIESY